MEGNTTKAKGAENPITKVPIQREEKKDIILVLGPEGIITRGDIVKMALKIDKLNREELIEECLMAKVSKMLPDWSKSKISRDDVKEAMREARNSEQKDGSVI